MIDDPRQAKRLLDRLEASLPLPAIVTPEPAAVIRERSPGADPPRRRTVTKTFCAGDEGGILCGLDLGDRENAKEVFVVSITHLAFDPELPLARKIAAYQEHRIERLPYGSGSTRAEHGRSRRRRPARSPGSGRNPVPKAMTEHY
jgi:hypothetical protein